VTVQIPRGVADRVEFLRETLGLVDALDVVERAVKMLDLAVCAVVVEGGRLCVRGRDGSLQQLDS